MSSFQKSLTIQKLHLAQKKAELSLGKIKSMLLEDLHLPRGRFKDNISNKDEAIIAEIKKLHQAQEYFQKTFDPIKKAIEYEAFGASALSIVRTEDFFMGSVDYLKDVKQITALPILRKDFMIDEYQIYESKLIGAGLYFIDCIDSFWISKSRISLILLKSYSLDYLIEVHDEDELHRVEAFSRCFDR